MLLLLLLPFAALDWVLECQSHCSAIVARISCEHQGGTQGDSSADNLTCFFGTGFHHVLNVKCILQLQGYHVFLSSLAMDNVHSGGIIGELFIRNCLLISMPCINSLDFERMARVSE